MGVVRENKLKNVGHQLRPDLDAGGHVAAKDPVKLGRVHPRVLDVVDLELDVGRGEGGLVGREVVAYDLGRKRSSGQYELLKL
jgi:hypothetical protein